MLNGIRRQVPPLAAAVRQVVDGNEKAEHDDDARRCERRILRLPPFELIGDLPPHHDRIEQHEHESGPGHVLRVLTDLGPHDEDERAPRRTRATPIQLMMLRMRATIGSTAPAFGFNRPHRQK